MNRFEKLQVVQEKLKCNKSQYNSFGKYNYRSCEDILESVKPLLAEVKAALTISDEVRDVSGRFYVVSTARFYDTDTGEYVEVSAFAREEVDKKGMDSSQVTGSTSSYARKYALNGLFGIDDTKDSDFNNTGSAPQKETPSHATPSNAGSPTGDELSKAKVAISTLAKKLQAGGKKDEMMEIIKKFVSSGNPNAITDLTVAQQLYSQLNKL